MAAAAQLTPLTAYTNAAWNEQPIRFWVGNLSAADNFTGYTFDATLTPRGTGAGLAMTSAGGTLVVTLPNVISISVPKASMGTLTPGVFDLEIRKTSPGGTPTDIARAVVTIVQGLGA